ncbi:TonB family protein [Proteus vulgaris]|uniref:TonB family protein n=1 Tax=Proteus vulgaris TaxID=585 RepID=UPI0018E4B5A8|nr:TonB family protein [Proteus vulgaris]MBI6531025.1 TonB family protein [Proteus vulgaris]
MKIKLAILSLFCSTSLLNGCATQSIQPDAQSNLLLKPKLVNEPEKLTQSEINEPNLTVKNRPKNLFRVFPNYPVKAYFQGIEGALNIKFDIDENGYVQNIRMLDSPLVEVFGLSAVNAMEKWRYESGKPTKDLNLTMEFKR